MRAVTRKEDLELWTGGRKEKVYEVRRKQQDFSQAAFQTDHTGISGTVFAVPVSGWFHDWRNTGDIYLHSWMIRKMMLATDKYFYYRWIIYLITGLAAFIHFLSLSK